MPKYVNADKIVEHLNDEIEDGNMSKNKYKIEFLVTKAVHSK